MSRLEEQERSKDLLVQHSIAFASFFTAESNRTRLNTVFNKDSIKLDKESKDKTPRIISNFIEDNL